MNDSLIGFLDQNNIFYEIDVDLKSRTWIHRGGMANIFISPKDSNELEKLVVFLYKNDISFLLIGHTSNIYILNECNIPVVVSTSKCRYFSLDDGRLYCESGVGVINLSKQMIQSGIRGFEYLTGLPGTVGAALVNNSSCRTNSISELLISARVVLRDGSVRTFTRDDFKYEFRSSAFKHKTIEGTIVSANLMALPGDIVSMQRIATDNDMERNRLLDGNSKNLGCTVNSCFINGKMPFHLRIALRLFSLLTKVFIHFEIERQDYCKRFICTISGYKEIIPYVSSKNIIVFRWLDEGADAVFPLYLEFMKKVYMTDKIEIEIIK